ncbi:MAG: phosphoenolpyruvate--protein phosphotransferase [Chitinispirillaceae bacterium]
MDHIQLICDIGEITEVFAETQNIESFLQKIVDMVANHMDAAVCSVYLYDEDRRELVLRATRGLKSQSINKVRLKLGEGLAGLALKELRPVYEKDSSSHPNFKYFPETAEEKYHVFMAVPIIRGLSRIGVLVIQRKKRAFKDKDIVTLRAVASQLANMLENARLLMTLRFHKPHEEKKTKGRIKLAKGKVASQGFAMGPARIIDRDRTFENFLHRKYETRYSLEDFTKALSLTEHQLEDLQARVEEKLSDVASLIFTAHLLLLKDTEFVGAMKRKIEQGMNPPDAVLQVAKQYVELFSHGENNYIKEKVQDIEDLTIRLMGNLVAELRELYRCEKHVVIARELFPSDMLKLSSENVLGVVLVTGGVTSHLSILARSLGVALVIVDSPRLLTIPDGTNVILDAEVGNLHINPTLSVISSFSERNEAREKVRLKETAVKEKTKTADGERVKLLASINLLSDVRLANEMKCEGIGLYRTEFPFLIRSDFPSEEEQYVVYRQLVKGMPGKEIVFRTLDIGGDKVLSYYDFAKEQNPFLGMRSIRFSLSNKETFVQQIRAMLRAGYDTSIRIMFPMISSIEEFQEAKITVMDCITQLKKNKVPHNSTPRIGMMIEVPSVVEMLDLFTKEVDFFSVGTNDLVQYMLAVDRTNEKVAGFYIPHHPSVMRAVKRIADAAGKEDKEVLICGDMAHQETYIPFFLGCGIRTLSLEAQYVPRIQKLIEKTDSRKAEDLALKITECGKVSEIARLLR